MKSLFWQPRAIFGPSLAALLTLIAIPVSRAQSQDAVLQPTNPPLVVPSPLVPPPLSVPKAQFFANHPDAWNQFLAQLPRRQPGPPVSAQQASPAFGGTWQSPCCTSFYPTNPLLLTDGTVIAHGGNSPDWYKLTPDITGSYVNGTWSQIASLPVINGTQYAPLYFASAVLPDGRVVIMGGEYNNGVGDHTTMGAIYDPNANTWTAVSPPTGAAWFAIGDAQSAVLANGTFLLAACCAGPTADALFNAGTLGWTGIAGPTAGGGYQDEQGYSLLPNGNVLTIDIWTCYYGDCGANSSTTNPTNAEQYSPSSGTWSSAGNTPVSLVDSYLCGSWEIGPAALRPDGTLVAFGGNSGCSALTTADGVAAAIDPTAIYDSSGGSWSAGPNVPAVCGSGGTTSCSLADAPAALLPSGNILFAASAGGGNQPTHFFEFTSATSESPNTIDQVADTVYCAGTEPSYAVNFLVLPNGQILATDLCNAPEFYTPTGTPNTSWAPTITSAPSALYAGATYPISGTQFNGLSQGAYYGDDVQGSSNYPIVQITNATSGHVFYARTFNHSTMSIAPGTAGSTNFTVPENVETGPSSLVVIANGIASSPVSVAVQHSGYAKPPDFDGDGDSDLLFHNSNGDVQVWLMTGGTVKSKIDLGVVNNDLSIVGTGDFNGDGTTDILLRNNITGDVQVWLMKAGSINTTVDLGVTSNAWTIVGTGDYNGDGTADILLRNTNGAVEIWFMNTSGKIKSTSVVATVATSWTIVGTGDYNGDHKADILWHNSNGDGSIWYMNGASRTSQYTFGPIPASWTILGSGDFDGNGTADILWGNSNGDGSIWFMNTSGTRTSSSAFGPVATSWSVIATSAFSAGDSDILWRNANGQLEIWFMSGGTRTSTSVVGTFPFTNTVVQ